MQTSLQGFQRNSKGLFVPSPGGLPGFQRQGMDQRKKSAGGLIPAVCTWDAAASDASISLSNANLRAAGNTGGTFANVHSTVQHSSGKWYLEITNVLTQAQAGGVPGVGFVIPAFSSATYIENSGGYGWLTYGQLRDDSNANVSSSLDVWNQAGDVLCIAVDLGARQMWAKRAVGGVWNAGGTADPATGIGGYPMGAAPGAGGAAVVIAGMPYSNAVQFDLNTGQSAFASAMPSGFTNWG